MQQSSANGRILTINWPERLKIPEWAEIGREAHLHLRPPGSRICQGAGTEPGAEVDTAPIEPRYSDQGEAPRRKIFVPFHVGAG